MLGERSSLFFCLFVNGATDLKNMFWQSLLVVAVFAVCHGVSAFGMVGGYRDANITDQGVQDALQFAVVKHNEMTNDLFLRQVSSVISAEKQVVSGINYRFKVQMGQTACRKTGVETDCQVQENPEAQLPLGIEPQPCNFKIKDMQPVRGKPDKYMKKSYEGGVRARDCLIARWFKQQAANQQV